MPLILSAMKDDHPYVRLQAAEVLGDMGYRHKLGEAIEKVASSLSLVLQSKTEEAWVKCGAAEALGLIAHSGDAVIDALLAGLGDADRDLRFYSAWSLGRLRAAPRAFEPLIRALKDEDFEVRAAAADALGLYGSEAIAALKEALTDPESGIHDQSAQALGKIGGDGVKILRELFKDPKLELRIAAVKGFAKAGPEGEEALEAALSDPNKDIQRAAAEALESVRKERRSGTYFSFSVLLLLAGVAVLAVYLRRYLARR